MITADFLPEWLVVLNPHAGCGRGFRDKGRISGLLDSSQLNYKLVVSEYPRHAITLTKEFIEQGYRKIIVAGGDGTLNEIVNGIFLQEAVPPGEIIVAMLPVGTGNDWIKTFGIPADYEKALKIILDGKVIKQDIGKVSFTDQNEEKVRFFANMAGFGFDAMVARKANSLKEKGRSGLLVYLQSLISSFVEYQVCKTKITIGENQIDDLVFSASIGIGKFNGGGMMQAPFAVPDNGEFQVTVIKKIGILGILRNIGRLYTGDFIKDRRVSTFKSTRIKIIGSRQIPGEVDGEILGNSTFIIEMVPERLSVIYGDDKYFATHPVSHRHKKLLKKPATAMERINSGA
ncbi:MAG: diacylglycerol kinase family lipid kinase [Bacteroidales bacterium]|nr:diacylglycerol kinase family lipid kinase [Bacteroidales bacterium]